jgi:hypothetical protein
MTMLRPNLLDAAQQVRAQLEQAKWSSFPKDATRFTFVE